MPKPLDFIKSHADVEFANQQLAFTEQRLSIAQADVAFYQEQRRLWICAISNGVSGALFDLMNSGISHRRYLKFIRSLGD